MAWFRMRSRPADTVEKFSPRCYRRDDQHRLSRSSELVAISELLTWLRPGSWRGATATTPLLNKSGSGSRSRRWTKGWQLLINGFARNISRARPANAPASVDETETSITCEPVAGIYPQPSATGRRLD